jgi:cytochrome c6
MKGVRELKKILLPSGLMVWACLLLAPVSSPAASAGMTRKELFERHCANCHPDGGNRLNPLQTLRRSDLEANGFRTARDIVNKMRDPEAFSPHLGKWSAMKKFDRKVLPDEDAFRIAEYVLDVFR